MKNVLVISPHPDDDVIGCGGTIRKHVVSDDVVEVVYLTSGENGGHGRSAADTLIIREEEANTAAGILQISKIDFWREPDGKLLVTDNILHRLIHKLSVFSPDIIYVTHYEEDHPDHQAAASLVTLTLSEIRQEMRPVVWMYEVWTPIRKIHHIVDITPYIDLKCKAIQAHQSQCSVLRFDEAITGLNRYRGEMHSWPGGPFAEIFTTVEI